MIDGIDVRRAREIVPGAFLMVTRRCAGRRFLLRPDLETVQAWKYSLGYCQGQYGVALHEFNALSNHHHLGCTDQADRPDFFRDFHSMMARSINSRWGDWGPFWDPEPYNDLRGVDEDAVLTRLSYMINNAVEAGLVRDPTDWLGANSYCMKYGDVIVVDRPDFFFSKDMPKQVEIKLTRPPILQEMNDAEVRAFVLAVAKRDREPIVRKFKEAGGTFVKMERVLRQPRHSSPLTRAPRRGIAPTVASCTKWNRISALQHKVERQARYTDCRKRHEGGEKGVVFPFGTYLLHKRYHVAIEPPPEWATTPIRCSPELRNRLARPP